MEKFDSFLAKLGKKSFWAESPVIAFHGKEYSFHFFYILFLYLEENSLLSCELKRTLCNSNNIPFCTSSLKENFLGNRSFYWLGDITGALSLKKNSNFYKFLCDYEGPNQLAFFIDSSLRLDFKKISYCVGVEDFVDFSLYKKLLDAIGGKQLAGAAKRINLVRNFFSFHGKVPLNFACVLANWISLVSISGQSSKMFLDYICYGLSDTPVLFDIADAFFSKNSDKFFDCWSRVFDLYPAVFWAAYWSDQIWRAHHVVSFSSKMDFAAARRFGFNLPFSFLNRSWKKYHVSYFAKLHDFLYGIDFSIKRGSQFCSFDLFFFNHFFGGA
jgi:hypothetical protein